jgi:hypothetical protein
MNESDFRIMLNFNAAKQFVLVLPKVFPACDKRWIPSIMENSNFGTQPSRSFREVGEFQTFFALGWLKQPARNLKALIHFFIRGLIRDLEVVGLN